MTTKVAAWHPLAKRTPRDYRSTMTEQERKELASEIVTLLFKRVLIAAMIVGAVRLLWSFI